MGSIGRRAWHRETQKKWSHLRSGIQARLILLLLIVLVPVILLQTAMHYRTFRTLHAQELQANLEIARAAARNFDEFVDDVLRQELAIGYAIAQQPFTRQQLTQALEVGKVERGSILTMSFVDPRGFVTASTEETASGLFVGDRPYFKELAEGKDFVLSDFLVSKLAKTPIIAISRKVYDSNRAHLGAIVARVLTSQLDDVIGVKRAGHGSLLLVDTKGQLVYRQPATDLPGSAPGSPVSLPSIEESLKGTEMTAVSKGLDGKMQLIASSPIRSFGWTAVVCKPQDEVIAPIISNILSDILLLLMVGLTAFFTALAISRTIANPIRKLRDHALALGSGGLTHGASLEGPAELRDLAEAFTEMANEIREREEVLRSIADEREKLLAQSLQDSKELAATVEALRQSEDRYRGLVELAPDLIALHAENRFIYVNPAGAELLGAAHSSDLIGRPVLDIIHPDFRAIAAERIRQTQEQREPTPLREVKIVRIDGTTLDVDVLGMPSSHDGKPATQVIMRNITDRKRAEQAVRESEARFRVLSETAGRLLTVLDAQKIIKDLCTQVMTLLDAHVFFNFLVDEEAGKLHLNAWAGISDESAREIEWLEYGVAVCGCVARSREPLVVQDILNTPDVRTDLVKSYGVQAYACHPLIVHGQLIGTLSFGTRTRAEFSSQDLAVMKTVTDQVATAIERTRLIRELQRSREDLEIRVLQRTFELEQANEALRDEITERISAEDALRESEQKFREVLDNSLDAAYRRNLLIDAYDYLSPAFVQIAGFTPVEMMSMPTEEVLSRIHPDDVGTIRHKLDEVQRDHNGHCHLVYRFRHKDGSYRWFSDNIVLIKDPVGHPVLRIGSVRDITEQKEMEQALRQSEARYRSIFDNSVDGILLTTPEAHTILQANSAACHLLQDSEESICQLGIEAFLDPADPGVQAFLEAREKDGKAEGEIRFLNRKGAHVPIEASSTVFRDEEGGAERAVWIIRDIKERAEAQEQVRKTKALLQTVFDGISDPLLMVENDLTIRMLNDASLDYFGLSHAEEAIGRTCYDLLHQQGTACDDCSIQSAIREGKKMTFERKGVFDPERFEQVVVYPALEAASGFSGVIIRISDVTESKNIEKHLMRADRLSSLGQLSGGIAHEIRNPLSGINLFVDILSDEDRFNRTDQELTILGEIKSNIAKINGIIKRVLDFARQPETALANLDMATLVDDTLRLWHSRFRTDGIALHLGFDEGLSKVPGDPVELQQVLNNLIQNSIEAMGGGGSLTITAQNGVFSFDKTRAAVLLRVQDSGSGIPAEEQKNIFNPFFTTKPSGTGLGLAISHRILERHGGIIWFESSPDTGTTFHIELPAAAKEKND